MSMFKPKRFVKRVFNRVGTPPVGGDITSGLIGWYRLDDGVSPTSNSGTGGPNITITDATFPGVGQMIGTNCLSLDGTNDKGLGSYSGITDYPFTLAVWAKTTSNNQMAGISYAASSSNIIYHYIGLGANKYPSFASRSSGGEATDTYTTTAYNDTWVHLLMVFTSSTSRSMYVNGAFVATNITSVSFEQPNQIGLGFLARSSEALFWIGTIDDARIYNRALSVLDITTLYEYR